jgi:ElaB/YqjD/DUF883 family membrane-anchored ribosome-binding protein
MSTQQRIEAESHKDPDILEREIEQKRAEIDGIVHALENKLSPGQMFDRVLAYAKGNGGELLGNLGDSIKGNPLAALLTSIGLAWLMSGRQPARARPSHSYSSGYDAWRTEHGSNDGMHLKERAGALKDRAAHLRDEMSEGLHDARERLGDMRDDIGERAHHASEAVRHTARNAQQSLEQMLREQPLAVAAIGIAAGALIAALLPPTRQEDEWLGRGSDQLKQRGRALAEQGLERAEHELEAAGEQTRSSSRTTSMGGSTMGGSTMGGSTTDGSTRQSSSQPSSPLDRGSGAHAAPPSSRSH